MHDSIAQSFLSLFIPIEWSYWQYTPFSDTQDHIVCWLMLVIYPIIFPIIPFFGLNPLFSDRPICYQFLSEKAKFRHGSPAVLRPMWIV